MDSSTWTCQQRLRYINSEYSVEDLPGAMDDRDWENQGTVLSAWHSDNDNVCVVIYIYIYIYIWFGFFVLWHINLHGLFNAKAILVEELK